ncbi:MAG: HU family DNA-binding protein [Chloroflexota bacterium]|nr:MAG: DNA-binding protein HU [Chloroflexota bacterium]
MPVGKAELEQQVADDANLNKAQAKKAVDAVFRCITDTLRSGEKVNITGFGSFGVTETAARQGRNPRTNEPLNIPAGKRPSFKAGSQLKSAVGAAGNKA